MRVSIGVLPTSLTKKSCSITEADTVLREGSLSSSLPNLVGWLGYWVLQYSSSAHWDFSCSCSMVPDSVRPHASTMGGSQSSSQHRSQRIQCRAFCVVMLLLSEPCVPATNSIAWSVSSSCTFSSQTHPLKLQVLQCVRPGNTR